jgi:hypothetical protein
MSKAAIIFQMMALIASSAFSGTLLFIAIAIVKFWQAVEPDLFLSWMTEHFFRFPLIMIPLNIASVLMAISAVSISWKPYPNSRLPLSLALTFLFICSITFPIYFAGANQKFIGHSIDLADVARSIAIWSNWHWLRTGLAILAVVCVGWGLFNSNSKLFNDR